MAGLMKIWLQKMILDELRSLKLWKEKQERKEKGKKRVDRKLEYMRKDKTKRKTKKYTHYFSK